MERQRRSMDRLQASPVIIFLSVVVLMLFSQSKSQGAELCEPWVAKLVSVEGAVEARPAKQADWRSANIGETFCPGDSIRLHQYRAAIVLSNETIMRLDAGTTLTFTKLEQDEPTWLDLITGMVHFISRVPRRLTITTPFVNGFVEGTEFVIRVDNSRTTLWVFEGRVLASNDLGTLQVASGEVAVAKAGQPPRLVTVVKPRDAVQWALYYPPIIDYRAVEVKGPASGPIRNALDAYGRGDLLNALDQLEAVPSGNRDVPFFILRAGLLLSAGRVEQAQADLAEATRLESNNGQVLALQSIIKLVQNEKEAALQLANQAVERAPESPVPWIARSYADQAAFDIEQAHRSVEQALKLAPGNALAWARLSELWLARGYLNRSLKAAEEAVARNPNLARTQTILGFAYLAQYKMEEAKMAFQLAIQLDQADPLPRLGLGLAKVRRSNLEEGRREMEIAASLDPNDAIIRSYLGKAYFEERRSPLAGTQFDMAKELDPRDPTPWFYDAIRKQLINRPVEALHDLQESIELNDNRAVYRGQLLLDQDVAARGATVGRIYENLGFHQRGRVEGWYSLSRDPASPMAHRLLSDMYSRLPRHEIARVSELLQSQLLQPLNTNNLQPQLAFSNLQIIEGAGPSVFSLNEFNPLFMRDQPRLQVNTIGGNNETYGGNVVGSILHGPVSLSAGAFRYWSEPDFRDNFEVQHTIYNIFSQIEFLPQLNFQVEYRHRETEQGDLVLRFDPDDFSPDEKITIEEDVARVGVRFTPGPQSDIIGSYIYSQRDQNSFFPSRAGGPSIDSDAVAKANQVEGQYLLRSGIFNAQIGGGYTHIDNNNVFNLQAMPVPFPPFCIPPIPIFSPPSCNARQQSQFTTKHGSGYVYINVHWPKNVIWTGGFAYESINDRSNEFDRVLPKAGLQWNLTNWARLRLSYIQTVKRPLVADQTIEPTQVAGFNQFFDDANGAITEQEGIALDLILTKSLYAGVQLSHRELESPSVVNLNTAYFDRREDRALGYVYWVPHPQLAFTAEGLYEQFKRSASDPTVVLGEHPLEVDTVTVPLSARFFHPSGFFAGVKGSFVWQQVDLSPTSTFNNDRDNFFLVDAHIGYRLPKRFGIVSLEARNLFDTSFHYQDLNAQTPRESVMSPFLPTRMVFGRLTLSF
jgi:tetratricopeptide (TPR) repeat protein